MVGKLSPRGNILELRYGKLHFQSRLSLNLNVIYSQPINFPCEIKPRSRYTVELIRSSSSLVSWVAQSNPILEYSKKTWRGSTLNVSCFMYNIFLSLWFPMASVFHVYQFTFYTFLCSSFIILHCSKYSINTPIGSLIHRLAVLYAYHLAKIS